MATLCEDLELFVDGELAPERAEALRAHLPDCAECQMGLTELLHLKTLGARYTAQQREPQPPLQLQPQLQPQRPLERRASPRWWRSRAFQAGSGFAALAAAVVAVVFVPGLRQQGPWTQGMAERQKEWRPSDPAMQAHRRLASKMLSGGDESVIPAKLKDRLKGDVFGQIALFLEYGRPKDAQDLLAALEKTPEANNDLALVHLSNGELEGALRLVELVLQQRPGFAPARWNRALILDDMGLTGLAAEAFEDIARQGEQGWSDEARTRAEDLRKSLAERTALWKRLTEAGDALVENGTLPEPAIRRSNPPILRRYFYDAVRVAPTRERVLALMPLAQELDRDSEEGALSRYVERIAASDFTKRAPLSQAYLKLYRTKDNVPVAEVDELSVRLRKSGETDLLLGALIRGKVAQSHLEEVERLAAQMQDPWFDVIARFERALRDFKSGDAERASKGLEKALRISTENGFPYREMGVRLELANVLLTMGEADAAREHSRAGLTVARTKGDWQPEIRFLEQRQQIAGVQYDFPVARAYLQETLLRSGGKMHQRDLRESFAKLEFHAFRFAEARAELDKAIMTGLPLELSGALLLGDVARVKPSAKDAAALEDALKTVAPNAPGALALAQHARGRFYLTQDRAKGRAALVEAIRLAEAGGATKGDPLALRARTYSYTYLILDAGQQGDFEGALGFFARELGMPTPARCAVALTSDSERSLLVVKGAAGTPLGYFEGNRTRPLPENLEGFVPAPALEALRGCEKVEVLAQPKLHGRSGLLPADVAWSYRLSGGEVKESTRPARPIHLVVTNVELPRERAEKLNRWNPRVGADEELVAVPGDQATPSRVLSEMEVAHEIDLVTHGEPSSQFGAAYLHLVRDGEKGDRLTAARIREQRLKGSPFVILAACYAARAAPVLHEHFSLPAALIDAGARGVIAATVQIPDKEADEFFNAIRARIREGTAPAVALRDERLKWQKQSPDATWPGSVLLFE